MEWGCTRNRLCAASRRGSSGMCLPQRHRISESAAVVEWGDLYFGRGSLYGSPIEPVVSRISPAVLQAFRIPFAGEDHQYRARFLRPEAVGIAGRYADDFAFPFRYPVYLRPQAFGRMLPVIRSHKCHREATCHALEPFPLELMSVPAPDQAGVHIPYKIVPLDPLE